MKNTEKVLYYCERKWQTRDEARQSSGFGIGLSIARSIAEGHHGRITATSPSDDVIVFTADLK